MQAKTFTKSLAMTFLTIFMTFLGFLNLVNASPVLLNKRVVFDPPVLDPHTGDVWIVGTTRNVTWDVSTAPKQISNPFGNIYLAQGPNLLMSSPFLAQNFSILLGQIEVTVPDVPTGIYEAIVMGDSGNAGSPFVVCQE